MKDGFNRYRRQFLIDLPIPTVEGNISAKIIEAADRRDFVRLDALVIGLFRLSDEHLSAIDRHLARLRCRRSTQERGA